VTAGLPIPRLHEGLISATASAAARSIAARGAVLSLAREVLRVMLVTRSVKLAAVVLAVGGVVSGSGLVGLSEGPGDQPGDPAVGTPAAVKGEGSEGAVATVPVKAGPWTVTLSERGSLEASREEAVISKVGLPTTIVKLAEEGRRVRKGDVIAELDSSALRDQLESRERVKTRSAEVAYQKTRLAREVSEIALVEYQKGIYPQELAGIAAEVAAAEEAVRRGQSRLERVKRAQQRVRDLGERGRSAADVVAELSLDNQIDDAEQTLGRERANVEGSKLKKKVLEEFRGPKTLKELMVEIEKARSDELDAQNALEKARKEQARQERWIADCTLRAPIDGVVVHADALEGPGIGGRRPAVEEGVTVRDRQVIVKIVDVDAPMKLNMKAHESIVDQLQPGQEATVKVDAYPGRTFRGTVRQVAPRPDPTTGFNEGIKLYTTLLYLEGGFGGLRPGMTAQAEVVLARVEDAVTVPETAVVKIGGPWYVAVKSGDSFEFRKVTLGKAGNGLVQVTEGLKEGDAVVPDPRALLGAKEGPAAKAAKAKK
jgi:RND family efflux transporter MFP subunit